MSIIQGIPDPGPGLRLHLNEHTGGCSPRVLEAIRSLDATALSFYPDYKPVVLETAAFLGVDPDQVLLLNGLDEGIFLTATALFGSRMPNVGNAVVPLPAFETYLTACGAVAARVVTVPPGPDLTFPIDGVIRAIDHSTKLVFVNNPNNPSGRLVPRADIRRVVEANPTAVVFVDEAYWEYGGESFLDELPKYPNVIIGRTFSKAYGMAGIRAGVMVAHPRLLERIRPIVPLFNLNVAAVAAVRAALQDQAFVAESVAQANESKALLYAALDRLGLRYWKSATNFVLVDGGDRAREIIDGLWAKQIFFRDRTKDQWCPNCFRITTGVVAHTRQAIAALEELCAAR
ncbi:MAG: histidinol-phosphate transaminase [Vicinamibacterales bacterium]|nr:histidinol-phosphate transaminase [Vicinamibacterales bacterium]